MNIVDEAGGWTHITTSGVTCITSAPAVLKGIFVGKAITGPIVQLWAGNATATAVWGTATLTSGFSWIPISLTSGFSICATNEIIDLTILWNPVYGVR